MRPKIYGGGEDEDRMCKKLRQIRTGRKKAEKKMQKKVQNGTEMRNE